MTGPSLVPRPLFFFLCGGGEKKFLRPHTKRKKAVWRHETRLDLGSLEPAAIRFTLEVHDIKSQ